MIPPSDLQEENVVRRIAFASVQLRLMHLLGVICLVISVPMFALLYPTKVNPIIVSMAVGGVGAVMYIGSLLGIIAMAVWGRWSSNVKAALEVADLEMRRLERACNR